MKYAFIQNHRTNFSVSLMCQTLEVARSAYYSWLNRSESERNREERRLGEQVKAIHERSHETYGTRRIQHDLVEDGERISRKRVGRLMKLQGLRSKIKRKFKATTNSKHNLPIAPNLLNRKFQVDQPDTVYVGDITYIHTDEGWLYLAVLIDLYSRAVVGWSMSNRMTAQLATDALLMAIWRRRPAKGLMAHSDRGSQYASRLYQKTLKGKGFICSMSRKGNCWDNAPSESFFHTLKTELIYHCHYKTREEATRDIFNYIEVFYNRQRRHSTIGYQTPWGYEKEYRNVV